jgi:hypothetical protein
MHFSRHQFEKAREQAKVHWPHDVMRHSYGSYHLAQYEDAARTSLRMGHTSTMILFNHYRDLVHRGDAERYWQILPKQSSGLIELGRPAASAAAEA